MSPLPRRQPRGLPAGGQFAAARHGEGDAVLVDDSAARREAIEAAAAELVSGRSVLVEGVEVSVTRRPATDAFGRRLQGSQVGEYVAFDRSGTVARFAFDNTGVTAAQEEPALRALSAHVLRRSLACR